MAVTNPHVHTEQEVLNSSFDETFGVIVTEPVRRNSGATALEYFNPATEEKQDDIIAALGGGSYAVVIRASGNYTYIMKAAIGSSMASAVWQAKRLDATTLLDVKWADGNDSFDNVANNYASLTYS